MVTKKLIPKKPNDGGPAFPSSEYIMEYGNYAKSVAMPLKGGMSLRAWFAGKALQGMLASGHQEAIEKVSLAAGGNAPKGLALASLGFADALIAELEKGGDDA